MYDNYVGGVYHKYDSMAYPEADSDDQSVVIQIFDQVTKFFSRSTASEKKMIVPSHESMQSYALTLYLEQFKQDLYDYKINDIEATTGFALQIFNALCFPQTVNDDGIIAEWRCHELSKV